MNVVLLDWTMDGVEFKDSTKHGMATICITMFLKLHESSKTSSKFLDYKGYPLGFGIEDELKVLSSTYLLRIRFAERIC